MKKNRIDWKNRIIEHGEMPAAQYNAHELNARRHPDYQREALVGSLNEVGWVAPVIVSSRTGKLLDGHARVEETIARDRNALIPFVRVDVTEEEEKLILATFDPITNQAIYDKDALDALLRDIQTSETGLLSLLADLAAQNELSIAVDDEDELPGDGGDDFEAMPDEEQTRVQSGDLWRCGRNLVLCGDSTRSTDVKRLFADGWGTNCIMVTDPPYGVEYDPSWRVEQGLASGNTKKLGKVTNDDRADWTETWQLFRGDVAYVYHAALHSTVVRESLENSGFLVRAQIIWAKSRLIMGRGDYHWKHEPCWYVVREGKPSRRNDDRTQTTVWEIDERDDGGHGHGTQKPVECMLRPIRNHQCDMVYDPFGGSGTTLIAAERARKPARLIEIEPKYVDIILTRWEAETGKTPELIERL